MTKELQMHLKQMYHVRTVICSKILENEGKSFISSIVQWGPSLVMSRISFTVFIRHTHSDNRSGLSVNTGTEKRRFLSK